MIVSEYLGHVLLGRLGLQAEYTAQRIFWGPVAIEGRDLVLDWPPLYLVLFGKAQLNSKFIFIVSSGEVVSIVDLALPTEDVDSFPGSEV